VPVPPLFAEEFGLDYHITNAQFGFVVFGRWRVDHRNSTGGLNLRERQDA